MLSHIFCFANHCENDQFKNNFTTFTSRDIHESSERQIPVNHQNRRFCGSSAPEIIGRKPRNALQPESRERQRLRFILEILLGRDISSPLALTITHGRHHRVGQSLSLYTHPTFISLNPHKNPNFSILLFSELMYTFEVTRKLRMDLINFKHT